MAAGPVALSVITVTYGRRDLLLQKAVTIAAQTLPKSAFDWRVVVNGDVDGTADALRAWAEREPKVRLHVFDSDRSEPIGAARNRAISGAAGDLLYLSDDDCLLAHDTLERHLACQEEQPGMWLGRVVFRADGRDDPWTPGPSWWQLNGANASLPAAAVAAVGGFDEELEGYGGEDLLLGWRLHREGVPCGVCASAKVVHLGPNPVAGRDLAKARQAGANAARIAKRHPELAVRLGVHPLVLAAKRVLYGAPWSRWMARIGGGRFAYERAYFHGAVGHREARQS